MDDSQKSADELAAQIAQLEKDRDAVQAKIDAAENHFAAIGKVAEAWAAVELTIDMGVWRLAGVEEQFGACVTSQIAGGARKLDAFISLAKLRGADDKLTKRINKFAETARQLQERRNRVVHDPWIFHDEDGPQRYEVSARRIAKMDLIPVPTTAVLALAQEIEGLWNDLLDISEITDTLASS